MMQRIIPLPESIESLWNQAVSEESFQTLVTDLKSWISEHWKDAASKTGATHQRPANAFAGVLKLNDETAQQKVTKGGRNRN